MKPSGGHRKSTLSRATSVSSQLIVSPIAERHKKPKFRRDGPSAKSLPSTTPILRNSRVQYAATSASEAVPSEVALNPLSLHEKLDELSRADPRLPFCRCFPLRRGCMILAIAQAVLGAVHSVVLIVGHVRPEYEQVWVSGFWPYTQNDNVLFTCVVLVDLVIGLFLGLYLLVATVILNASVLSQYVLQAAIYGGIQILKYVLVASNLTRLSDSTHKTLMIVLAVLTMLFDLSYRSYVAFTAVKLRRAVEDKLIAKV